MTQQFIPPSVVPTGGEIEFLQLQPMNTVKYSTEPYVSEVLTQFIDLLTE